ncbi:MAG: GspH/FimT family pseudopilin [Gammaproteobacteria bacterium]|nr:GspH/FimT family pseudopilin [Gammaproteobacteria bacterium]
MHGQQGFTLFELIITLAIAAVVVGLAAPSFSSMIQNNRLSSQSLDFVAALNLARSEAIKRRVRVVLCKSANGQDCVVDGEDSSTHWGQGWIVFVDNNNNQTRNSDEDNPANSDIILRVHDALSGNNRLTGNENVADFISYDARGFSRLANGAIQMGSLSLCDSRNDNDKARAIRINATGRPMLSSVSEARSNGLAVEECRE